MKTFTLVALLLLSMAAIAQQLPDTSFTFSGCRTIYPVGKGPVVFIDEAHHNFHTRKGGFSPFSKLLRQDGYRVQSLTQPITNIKVLLECKILVIANALHPSNVSNWILPTPSAFSDDEINIICQWVKNGGCLLLIADHMPFAGAACQLGKAFGFDFLNGFAMTGERSWPPSVFSSANKMLDNSPLLTGALACENINVVATFTGSAFKAPEGSIPVLSFLKDHYSLQPDTAWRFTSNTPSQNLGGFLQGALLPFGKGKIAVFGEAAMFTAQIVNGIMKVGINAEDAPQNAQFTLNLIHWLDGNMLPGDGK